MPARKAPPAPLGFAEVLAAGDHRTSLEALRDELAVAMADADANVKPQFAARIQAVLSELAGLPDPKGSAVDDLVARRQSRRDSADAGMRAKQRKSAGRSG